jgi:hypothetical protein
VLSVEFVSNSGNVGAFDKRWGVSKRRGRNDGVFFGWDALIVWEDVAQWLR